MQIRIIAVLLVFLWATNGFSQYVGVIPQPQSVKLGKDSLKIGTQLHIQQGDLSFSSMQYLRKSLLDRFQIYSLNVAEQPVFITFTKTGATSMKSDSYDIRVHASGIEITAGGEEGYFYAINSLLQLMHHHQTKDGITLPALHIEDSPAYGWRGFMLDESRHFFGKKKVKQLLDWMAFYKLNVFHWHLTDEPGWRIEIQQYPFLTLIGGIGNYLDPLAEAKYYTQADISEIVAYAAARQIEIIPEIDMPGHATAANRAYPQFSGGGTKDHPDFTFHPAKEGTYQYLSNILKEVSVLFPSNLIHLGGDEVAFGSDVWDEDIHIQELKATYDYTTNKEVENHFMRRMADSVFHRGVKLLVWDEMADAGLPIDKTIQYWWRHDRPEQLELLLKKGYSTVICPRLPLYLDFVQEGNHRYGRKWGQGYNSLQNLYDYDITQYKKMQQREGQILGLQGNLWTERIHTEERLDFMVFPRIAALAEIAWSQPSRKDFTHFRELLKKHLQLYQADNLYYYDPFNNTNSEPKVQTTAKKYIDNPE